MAVELKDAADRYELLERESQAKAANLKKAMEAANQTRSKMRGIREGFMRPEISRLGSPICCG